MITINNDLENNIIAYLYCPTGSYIGRITNYTSLLDVRRQVKETGKSGYHVVYSVYEGDQLIDSGDVQITSKGKLTYIPPYFFTKTNDLLTKLL